MGSEIWMVFLLLMPSLISCSACTLEERNSLLDFKQGINFTYYREYHEFIPKPLQSWRGLNCCSWEGVGCHPRTAHVITLDLFGYSIQWSEVRGGLFQLLHLEHLDLSFNFFTSLSIPPQIGELRRLKYLSLFECRFSGQIPREVTKLQKLEHLDLSENEFHGAFPREMGNISTLKFLSLSWNNGLQSNKLGEWITRLRGLEDLELSNMNLSMAQDTWLGGYLLSLANLTALSMDNCGLSGEIPPFFANLSRLQQLGLSGNSFRGNIPAFLEALPLSSLDLSENNLEGSIPSSLSTLSTLESLHLSSNKLNGSIPPALGNLSALNFLELENNSLSGPIPTSFAKLSNLFWLDLSYNRLNGTFSFFILNNCTELYGLDLSSNTLTVKVNDSIIPKFQLQYLALRECNVGGGFPAFISTQYSIRILDVSNNSHSGFIPDWLWGFADIEYIDLSYNLFDGSIIKSIDKYAQNLQFLSLAGNNLYGYIPASIFKLKNLDILDLSNNKFNGKISQCLQNCSLLTVLNLEKNNLEGMIPNICKGMDSLETLKLGDNSFEGYIPASFEKCRNLKILDLRSNNLQGNISGWVETLVNLQILILKNNSFNGPIPLQLTKLQNLQILDMSKNKFSGTLPKDFMKLTTMANQSENANMLEHETPSFQTSNYYVDEITIYNKGQIMEFVKILRLVKCLDLSSNNLSGSIPWHIGSLKGLIILNISRNHFSGEIPMSIGELTLLQSLDLSQNNLLGAILTELQLLTSLSYFNVSYNNLSGMIPQGGQMMTFDSTFFNNNPGLCGLQIYVACSSTLPNSSKVHHKDDQDFDEDLEDDIWWDMGMATGFVVGFSIVIGMLCLNKTWSILCIKIMDDIILSLL